MQCGENRDDVYSAYRRYATSHHQAAGSVASLRDACRARAPPSTTLRLTACVVLIALRALCLSEATIHCSIHLPTRRHIALDLADNRKRKCWDKKRCRIILTAFFVPFRDNYRSGHMPLRTLFERIASQSIKNNIKG